MIKLRLSKPPALQAVNFTRVDMKKLGLKTRQVVTDRVLKGLDARDRRMKPLSAKYAAKKAAIGQPPIRNMQYSGSMLGSMDVVEVSTNSVTVGFDRQSELIKAQKNDQRSKWFGLSPSDEAKILNFGYRILQDRLARMK